MDGTTVLVVQRFNSTFTHNQLSAAIENHAHLAFGAVDNGHFQMTGLL